MADSNAHCSPPRTRRTRFVCISDTHNCTVKLPKGDVLIHCGDLTNTGSFNELSKQVQWFEQADFECKIVVAGNHDLTLDNNFYEEHGAYRHGNIPQVPQDCQALLTESKSLTYLLHESRTIKLTSPSGPQTTFSVFGSPYSPAWGGAWAFQYPRHDEGILNAESLWEEIPLDTDILITHGPAHSHCDEARGGEAAGCEILQQQLWRVRPRVALCGHIHEARGVERVQWNIKTTNKRYAVRTRTPWQDPNPDSGKNALVDLTMKGGMPLDNDGSPGPLSESSRKDWQDRHTGDTDVPDDVEVACSGIGALSLGEDPRDRARRKDVSAAGRRVL
ncbi:hypothetical protein NPX13_g3805 [Xylaria arbuscula]|uniref:Calcineurin-like phosphoesterase domain-containing protein n=1 Tax=Xylaria arbuscula TaxID=114810 RepID=A0A9W8TPR5_9PEZI|nr:hypothetical protein NPX13_g3805 [Xylaria arbuscula]